MIEPFWKTFHEVCSDKNIGPEIVIRPSDYREHTKTTARAIVVREMAKRGVGVKNICTVSGLEERQVYRIIKEVSGNGHGPNPETFPTGQME